MNSTVWESKQMFCSREFWVEEQMLIRTAGRRAEWRYAVLVCEYGVISIQDSKN